jgi:dienelactone hydrolase
LPRTWNADGAGKVIICVHGHSADGTQFGPNSTITGQNPLMKALTDAGFALFSIDAAGGAAWSNDTCLTAMNNAVSYMTNEPLNGRIDRYGLMGFSMGGCAVLEFHKRHVSNVACTWAWEPALDLNYMEVTGGYTDVQTAYGGASWPSNIAGHSPYDEPANFRGLGRKIVCTGAVSDTTVPVSHISTFVTNVNDPDVTFRSISSGSHADCFNNVPPSEVVSFFQAGAW